MDTKKYIIEIPDNTAWLQWVKVSDKDGHVCFDFKDPEDLTLYTEPDLDAVRNEAYKEAYDKGYQDAVMKIGSNEQAIAEKAYQGGLIDAWDAARKIVDLPTVEERENIFACAFTNDVIRLYTATEAIEKIRQYEDEQKEQKQEKLLTVEDVMRQYLDTFCKNRICSDCPLYTLEFTCGRGNHFCTNHPVSDEEVRRAYAKVLKNNEISE